MTAEPDLLPLPEWQGDFMTESEFREEAQAYARACVSSATEALRAEVAPYAYMQDCDLAWVLVPAEPTDEMVEAAWDSDAADYVGEHKRIHSLGLAWSAMLAAAPQPGKEVSRG